MNTTTAMSDEVAIYLSAKAAAFSIDSILSSKQPKCSEAIRKSKNRRRKRNTLQLNPVTKDAKVNRIRRCLSPVRCHSLNTTNREIRIELQHQQLWEKFHSLGTEMIITKVGRRMFPTIRVKINGLKSDQKYFVMMDIAPVDDKRYRYAYHSSQWFLSGDSEALPVGHDRVYMHPDSPLTGDSWQKQVLAFDKIKLTNNDQEESGHIILQSMKKYQPRIHIIQANDLSLSQAKQLIEANVSDKEDSCITTFIFAETQFITVTAYQNQQITKLKIDRNPFAKGFRDLHRYRESDDVIGSSSVALVSRNSKTSDHRCISTLKAASHEESDFPNVNSMVCLSHRMSPYAVYPMSDSHQWFYEESHGKRNRSSSHLPWGIIRNQQNVVYSSIDR